MASGRVSFPKQQAWYLGCVASKVQNVPFVLGIHSAGRLFIDEGEALGSLEGTLAKKLEGL